MGQSKIKLAAKDPQVDSTESNPTDEALEQEIVSVLGAVCLAEHLDPKQRWDLALKHCKSRKVKGLTSLFRQIVPEPTQEDKDPVKRVLTIYRPKVESKPETSDSDQPTRDNGVETQNRDRDGQQNKSDAGVQGGAEQPPPPDDATSQEPRDDERKSDHEMPQIERTAETRDEANRERGPERTNSDPKTTNGDAQQGSRSNQEVRGDNRGANRLPAAARVENTAPIVRPKDPLRNLPRHEDISPQGDMARSETTWYQNYQPEMMNQIRNQNPNPYLQQTGFVRDQALYHVQQATPVQAQVDPDVLYRLPPPIQSPVQSNRQVAYRTNLNMGMPRNPVPMQTQPVANPTRSTTSSSNRDEIITPVISPNPNPIGNQIGMIDQMQNQVKALLDAVQAVRNQTEETTRLALDESRSTSNDLNEMRRTLDAKSSDPHPTKLRPYSKDVEDFSLFEVRFRSMWALAKWTPARALSELVQNLQTARAERIVKSRDMSLWTAETLLATCLERLSPNMSLSQVQGELYKLESDPTETPEQTMCRIEDVIGRAKSSNANRRQLNAIQREAFLRLIYDQQPMYFYVNERSLNMEAPYEALEHAKEYVRTKGHEAQFIQTVVNNTLKECGLKEENSNEKSESKPKPKSTSGKKNGGDDKVETPKANTQTDLSELTSLLKSIVEQGKTKEVSEETKFNAMFIPTRTQPEDWYNKVSTMLNEHERKMRAMQTDFTKVSQDMYSAGRPKSASTPNGKPQSQIETPKPKPRSNSNPRFTPKSKNGSSGKKPKPKSKPQPGSGGITINNYPVYEKPEEETETEEAESEEGEEETQE